MPKTKMMRFNRFGDKDVLYVEELVVSQPDAGQVLVQVHAASINPVDYKIRSGLYPAVKEDRLPYTPGRDVSGVVVACGAQATRFSVGDAVFGIVDIHGGGYSQQIAIAQAALAAKPIALDHVHAAAIPLAGQTAWQGLFRYGRLQAGQSVLIHGGSGGVGHFAIQFAKAKDARVLTTVSTANIGFAGRLGADVVIDYQTERFEDLARDVDLVFDLIGSDTRERSWGLLRKGGVLVTTRDAPSQDTAEKIGVRALRFTVEADGAELAGIADLVNTGKAKAHVERTFDLDAAAEALALVEQGHAVGKIVLAVV
ncbi:alcohol dehydrogenase [Caballeronia catudaia]|uniref:Alcohol dehydrogenase n=1 Tax=Caballeronia catudaia TaxID=1777136 RepID=A0A158DJ33_9BURK|nr:NADP-dependent oxidoreductase [Caballeronia catudaia]SAK93817.1 alcohol dehydrogenase [Caballeronia catudaia]